MANEKKQVRFMQGNEAVVEAAIFSGVRFFAGYPITPASEIAELMAARLPEVDGTFLQMEDEIASMGAVAGASMAGCKAMTASSGPGFSLKQENIGFASMAELPCVIVDVQRVGPASGLATVASQGDVMQARWGTHGDHSIVVLSPSTVSEAYELTIKAVNISEKLRTPVILLSDAVVGHLREKIVLPDPDEVEIVNRKITTKSPAEYKPFAADEDGIPAFAPRGEGYRYHMNSNVHSEDGYPADSDPEVARRLLLRLDQKVKRHINEITFFETYQLDDAEIALVAFGCTARSAWETVNMARQQGIKAGLLQLKTLWPFPAHIVKELGERVKAIVVPEMNFGQIVGEVERAVRKSNTEVYPFNRVDGCMITPQQILNVITETVVKEVF
ncbi:MAG: 2-oxoacid:acceptor oxidoreductase subunit alpha [bacterium]|jgi:2-oxoglutarate ferredoxin oxidoreductase subunit alpha